MVDAVEIAPAAHRVVAAIALKKAVLRAHDERLEGKRFGRDHLRDGEIGIIEQHAPRTEHELFRERRRVDACAQIDAEVLDDGLRFGIDDRAVECRFRNFEIRFGQQRRHLKRVLIVDEAVFRNRVGGKSSREILVEQQQVAKGVAILGDREATDKAVLRRRPQAGHFEGVADPVRHAGAVCGRGLREPFRGHTAILDAPADRLPDRNLAVFEARVQLIDADPGRAEIRVVALDAVLREEGLDRLFE